MHGLTRLIAEICMACALTAALAGCGKFKQKAAADPATARADAKRQQTACASLAAYDHVKGQIFDQAIRARGGDRANLDMLADYSQARMQTPLVESHDETLDVTHCTGRFVLDIPPGAERGLGGERRLQADIAYSAQAAADKSGLVYKVDRAEPIVARLAAFNMSGQAYRPPPAIDAPLSVPDVATPTTIAQADTPPQPRAAPPRPAQSAERAPPLPAHQPPPAQQSAAASPGAPSQAPSQAPAQTRPAAGNSGGGDSGEGTVRAFYAALGHGDGASASARVISEKRSSRAFSPDGISRFYGGLPEPIRLTGIAPLAHGAYRVSYRYSAGRSHCNGSAIVGVTNRGGRTLIRSIRALTAC